MKLIYYQPPNNISNFGDNLNPWLWNKLLPNAFNEDVSTNFLGIGTILHEGFNVSGKKVVFSSGCGYFNPPVIDKSWHIFCVRGPLTARTLQISREKAVTDGACLISTIIKSSSNKAYKFSYFPHFEQAVLGGNSWRQICDLLGMQYIDPRSDTNEVLNALNNTECLITEALHGAVVADALRVPWIRVKSNDQVLEFKWEDWCESLNLKCVAHRIYPMWDLPLTTNMSQRSKHYLKSILLRTSFKSLMLKAARNLSSGVLLESRIKDLKSRLDEFKRHYLKI
ncbi:MAG: polysaccharide pyruvyl transferase family protein [Candidatus Omnitrophica bacterium]|nr:polysaccharide pyruvyl transferase family protein [Candidatus Omnitrophota bacterium]